MFGLNIFIMYRLRAHQRLRDARSSIEKIKYYSMHYLFKFIEILLLLLLIFLLLSTNVLINIILLRFTLHKLLLREQAVLNKNIMCIFNINLLLSVAAIVNQWITYS